MKKIIALALAMVMAFSMVACGGSSNEGEAELIKTNPEKIVILGQSSSEANMNILRDQLTKAGFEVELNTQPDYASWTAQKTAGNFDIALSGWTTVTGNVDYAVRGVYHSTGDYNYSPILDEKVDTLIDKGASETAEVAKATYTELENYMIGEMAYILPLYSSMKIMAYNNELLTAEGIYQPKSRPGRWEMYDYVDAANNDTRVLTLTQSSASPSTLDPIQANDGTMNTLSGNMYIKIVNLSDDDEIMTESSLSHSYAIGEGNETYYFLLRDDVNFAKVENGEVVDTGVLVAADDVVFSLERASNKESVATHKTYTLHNHMKSIEIVTDLEELKTVKDSDTGVAIIDTLNAGVEVPVAALTAVDDEVDNANGTYQVVKVTTTEPFPQVLNYLAHQSAGILHKEQVESYNSKFEVANYDPKTDICYGDFAAIKGGDTSMLWCSGPYQFVKVDDYGIDFVKNPGYMPEDECAPNIAKIYMKFIKDTAAATSAFRAGEVDILGSVATTDVEVVEADAKNTVLKRSSNGVTYAFFNLTEGSKFTDVNLRKAVMYAINQADFVAYNSGYVMPVYSTVGTLVETGNVHTHDLVESNKYLAAYQGLAE